MLGLIFEDELTPKNLIRLSIGHKVYLNPKFLDRSQIEFVANAQGSKRGRS